MSRKRSEGFSGDNEFNKMIESEDNNETNLLEPMTEKERAENFNEFKRLADQLATLSLSDNQSSDMKRHIDVKKKLFKDTLNKSLIDYEQRKKNKPKEIKPVTTYGGRKKSKRNKRMGRKSRKLMCPKNCCGVSVTKCGCPKSCRHCNCHEIKRLRKKLRKKSCKKSKRKKRRKRKKTKRRRR